LARIPDPAVTDALRRGKVAPGDPCVAAWRSAFLGEASQLLAASLGYERTLGTVVHLTVPALADYCIVDLAEPDGGVRRITDAADG
jgi:hypothetical protein